MTQPKTRKEMLLDDKFISTPDMGDFLDSSMIMEAAEEISKGETGGEFYLEKPFATTPGYYPTENVILISGFPDFITDPSKVGNDGNNKFDADTVYLEFDQIIDGGAQIKLNSNDQINTVRETLRQASLKIENADLLGVRVIGIDAPELPHYRYFPYEGIPINPLLCTYKDLVSAKDGSTMVKTSKGYIRKDCFSYVKYNPMTEEPTLRSEDTILAFLPVRDKDSNTGKERDVYYEVIRAPKDGIDKPITGEIKICITHDSPDEVDLEYIKQGLQAQQDLASLIANATDVIYMLDQTYLANKAAGLIPWDYKKEYQKISDSPFYVFESFFRNLFIEGHAAYQQVGKRYFGQELNGRYLGAIYVQHNTSFGLQWINVAKYLISKYPKIKTLPSYSNSAAVDAEFGNMSDAFKLWTYDLGKQEYLDKINNVSTDDRAEVQKIITGIDLAQLTNHTVMIGDCLLMVPPTSIRTVTQSRSQRTSMLRAKGSMTKSLPKTERIIEIQLFFNGPDAINGIPYEQNTPSDQTMINYMNGLRSLIAQYKFTPFLPIHNDYINYVLNIEAVSLVSIQVSTVPNYPKTLQATIRLQEFDYRQYMPEILPPNPENREDLYSNLFSQVIHWPTFRYYYQKAIRAGEEISNLNFDTEPYIEATVGQKTALQNMKFMTPMFELYIANEEMLKQRKSVKMSLEKNPIESVITFNKEEEKMIKEIVQVYECIRNKMAVIYQPLIKDGLFKTKDGELMAWRRSSDSTTDQLYEDEINKTPTGDSSYNPSDEQEPWMSFRHVKKVKNDAYVNNSTNKIEYKYEITTRAHTLYLNYIRFIRSDMVSAIKDSGVNTTWLKDVKYTHKQIGIPETWADGGNYQTDVLFGLELEIDWNHLGYKETLDKVRRLVAKTNNVLVTDVFKDKRIFIGWKSSFAVDLEVNSLMGIKTSNPTLCKDNDYETMSMLASSFGVVIGDDDHSLDDDMWTGPEDIGDMKDNIDIETSKSVKYDLYDIGSPIIKNISFAYNNIFSNMSLKMYDGYASQYTGGSDTSIEISMTATDEYTVSKLQLLSRICAQRIIDFRKILSTSPLRINSEMTRFMGVNEVIIESVDINTVPNFPGTWDIVMTLTSVDRTLRNREALKKIDDIKNEEINMDTLVKTKNFFDIKNALAKVELYPDLELPTISELEKLGYYFIKYKADSSRVFPDADFYFSYLHVFSSDMLRETIVNFFKDSKNEEIYRQYTGDLYNNDSALSKWNIGRNPDTDSKMMKPADSQKIKDNSDPVTASAYTVEGTQPNVYNNTLYTKDAQIQYKEIEDMSNVTKDKKPSELAEIKSKTDELIAKAKGVEDSVNLLREALETSNYDTFDFNPVTKIAIKSSIPFSQEKFSLSEPKDIRKYVGNNKFKTIKGATDRVNIYNNSLKKMILEILSKPIELESCTHPAASSVYNTLLDYLVLDTLGSDVVNITEQFDTFGEAFSVISQFRLMLDACARGATAKLGVLDTDDINETLPISFVDRVEYKEDLSTPEGELDVIVGSGPKPTKPVNVKTPNIYTPVSGQGLSSFALAETKEEQMNGIIFGKFGIKKYSPSILSKICGITIAEGSDGFLDPYYNAKLSSAILKVEISAAEEKRRIKEYIDGMFMEENKSMGHDYSANAFFRNMLMWFYKLLDDDRQSLLADSFYLIGGMKEYLEDAKDKDDEWYHNLWQFAQRNVSIGGSISLLNAQKEFTNSFSSEQQEKLDEKQLQQQVMDKETELEKELEQLIKDVKKDIPRLRLGLMSGLFFTLGAIALNEFNTPIYTGIKGGDLGTISTYIQSLKGANVSGQDLSIVDMQMRRMFQYADSEFNTKSDYDNVNYKGATDQYSFQGKTQRLYLKAAETPSVYLLHSFYDMVTNDCRGRMARAFPTYYMLLIDEGRDLGVWRLQDNFYDVSSITEFQVVKSRKIAADTAKIVMTNLFGTFTTEDDDMKDEYQYTFKDMFNSVFSPQRYVEKEYQRYSEARDINRAKLKPGARVNLRMGYSADASKLPIVFNGSVAELQEGDLMTIVCQGDGIELANPAMFNATDAKDVADIQYNDSLIAGFLGVFEDNTTPRDILLNPLIAEGTFIHEIIKDWSKGRLYNSNPFGITHFGDKHFNDIFTKNGEVEQNIYEALNRPSWGDDVQVDCSDYSYALTSAPKIKVGLEGNRSYWDLMHIAASVSPDYICAVVPFQLRSSVFYGAGRYYYAYDYDKLPNGQLVEKRKPFQQYHVYTSYTDILNNGITASDKEVRTCAVGIYQKPGVFTGSKSGSVGPLYLDIDIFPEKQKMTTINCNFEYINFDLIPFTIPLLDSAMNEISDTGGYQIAWRATANGLRDTVKDMYTGELIVIGDPSVKPYDKIYINDLYEDMQGMCDVESVVHTFSVETGFTTSITPDCVSAIDNKYEQIATTTIKEMLFPFFATHTALVASSKLFANVARALFFSVDSAIKISSKVANTAVNSVGSILGKDNLAQFAPYTDKFSDALGYGFGVTPIDASIYRSVAALEEAYDFLGVTRKFEGSKDLTKFVDDLLNFDNNLKALDPSDLSKLLDSADSQHPDVIKARKDAADLQKKYNDSYSYSMNNIDIEKKDIDIILEAIEKSTASKTDDVKKAIDLLKSSNGIKYTGNIDDITKQLEALRKVVGHVPDVTETSNVAKIFTKLDNKIFGSAKTSMKMYDNVGDTFKAVNNVRKGAIGLKATLSTNLLWLAAEIVISKSVKEYIERKMKNWQVLTVFPLMKEGKVVVAGLDGNKGSVFGSPSYTQSGWLEEMSIKFFEYKSDNIGGWALTMLRDMFITSPEMLKIVDSYKRDAGFDVVNGSNEVVRQAEIQEMLSQVAKSNVTGFNAYKKLYFDARVESRKSDAGNIAYHKYKLVDITEEDIRDTRVISNALVPVASENNLIERLADKNVFKFVGEASVKTDTDTANYVSDKYVLLKATEGSEDRTRVPCKKIITKNANGETSLPVFVLPYLRADALVALTMVVEKICERIQPDYLDDNCKFEYLHKHNIVLHNGVMVNSKTWMSTGFGFMLEVKNYKEYGEIVKAINEEDKEIAKAGNSLYKLLDIQKDTILGQTYVFSMSPIKV